MRPRERLLRKRINPNDESAIRKALEKWSDRLSIWEHVFTGAVVAGLIIEYLAEITSVFSRPIAAILRSHDLQLREWGGLFVILGVAGELLIGVWSSRVETALRDESNSALARANDRAANAEREAAEANLARVKIEQRMKWRVLTSEDLKALLDLVTPMRKAVDVVVFDHHISETVNFARQITKVFVSARWIVREWQSRKATYRLPGSSVVIGVAIGHASEVLELANKLASVLSNAGVDCIVSPNSFDCSGQFTDGDFAVIFQEPTIRMGVWRLAPLRVQIGEKQLSPEPTGTVIVGRIGRPVTPPQA